MNFSAQSILLALISTIVIFCGCSKKEPPEVKVVAFEEIQNRGGVYYEVNQETPFTGRLKQSRSLRNTERVMNIKDGKRHGPSIDWHEDANGQKKRQVNYKVGKKHGVETRWDENGVKQE
jgi:antitoxin component YwqK of YwqJK toxin-antitoxin module